MVSNSIKRLCFYHSFSDEESKEGEKKEIEVWLSAQVLSNSWSSWWQPPSSLRSVGSKW